jgi:hypothetical protein
MEYVSDNPFEESKDLQQTGGIDDYIMAFEYVSSGREVAGGAILGVLHGGPQDRLRVRTFNPRTRIQAMKLARDVKNKLRGSLAPEVDLVGPKMRKIWVR